MAKVSIERSVLSWAAMALMAASAVVAEPATEADFTRIIRKCDRLISETEAFIPKLDAGSPVETSPHTIKLLDKNRQPLELPESIYDHISELKGTCDECEAAQGKVFSWISKEVDDHVKAALEELYHERPQLYWGWGSRPETMALEAMRGTKRVRAALVSLIEGSKLARAEAARALEALQNEQRQSRDWLSRKP